MLFQFVFSLGIVQCELGLHALSYCNTPGQANTASQYNHPTQQLPSDLEFLFYQQQRTVSQHL